MRLWLAALAGALAILVLASPAHANVSNCAPDPPPAASARIVSGELDGLTFNVLLPRDYSHSSRRYPVLYLLLGLYFNENTWLDQSDLAQFTAPLGGDQAAIVVMPDGGPDGFYTDWQDGTEQWETYHIARLVPYIDAHFRTFSDRAHRAVAGFSLGGMGAVDYAARHPDLFSAVGSFSGVDDLAYPNDPYRTPAAAPDQHSSPAPPSSATGAPYTPPTDAGSGCGEGNSFGSLGDPATNYVGWRNHNPTDLAFNLHGVSVYVAAGNGVPCGPQDVEQEQQHPNFGAPGEPALKLFAQAFAGALSQEGVPHVEDFYACGVHSMLYGQRDLRAFWSLMLAAFGKRSPRTFAYRNADPAFAVWGWTFQADSRRAAEFLDIVDAGAQGVTLVGSGREQVTTAPYFSPGQTVELQGATTPTAIADHDGRLTFTADLGPPHTTKQFTPGTPSATFGRATVHFSTAAA